MKTVMKNKILIIIVFIIFSATLTSCYKAPEYDITVYKTSAGAKYHKINCRYVKGKAIEINLSRALYDSLEACKVCNPPKQSDLDKLN
jgi:hypothetical protein